MEEKNDLTIMNAIKLLRENSKKRNFSQSFDLILNLKKINLKKPENKFTKEIVLPYEKGKKAKSCVISNRVPNAVNKEYIMSLEKNKKDAKAFVKKYDFFLCDPELMPLVGKVLGRYMGPSGKMPKVLPPNQDPAPILKNLEKSIRIKLRDSPCIHAIVGKETMNDDQIEENVKMVIEEVQKSLPKGANQIKSILLKLTMSRPVEITKW
jgi:large subunit ribosomal protein L1